MLAMCVRKAADPSGGTPTVQASTLTSTGSATTAKGSVRRHKPLKAMRSRGTATTATGMQEASEKVNLTTNTVEVDCTVKVRDSPDGHLIYHKGDLVDQRCKFGGAATNSAGLVGRVWYSWSLGYIKASSLI